ncbi:MAG: thiol:disulfide interchange protein DsbA/DsbL [Zoogloeaceae bacterium]|jgi:thiol:disulfide interchange protein DsbA|nr:thiol:disulfide interchange protein DsbA/DsbL [Zoogloeaceae bacterium]
MFMRIKKWLAFAFIAALVAGPAAAQIQAGRDYKPLASPQTVESGDKIEVVEFFWYGCPHCFDLEPFLRKWTAQLPADVTFRRIPAIPTQRWAPNARTFYTLETLGLLDRLHGEVFDAVHIDRVNFDNEMVQLDWMTRHGVDRAKFSEAWRSFSVQSKTRRAAQLTQAYDVNGVPTLIVDGKYQTSVSMTGSPEALMKTLDELIVKARAERPKKK